MLRNNRVEAFTRKIGKSAISALGHAAMAASLIMAGAGVGVASATVAVAAIASRWRCDEGDARLLRRVQRVAPPPFSSAIAARRSPLLSSAVEWLVLEWSVRFSASNMNARFRSLFGGPVSRLASEPWSERRAWIVKCRYFVCAASYTASIAPGISSTVNTGQHASHRFRQRDFVSRKIV